MMVQLVHKHHIKRSKLVRRERGEGEKERWRETGRGGRERVRERERERERDSILTSAENPP